MVTTNKKPIEVTQDKYVDTKKKKSMKQKETAREENGNKRTR